MRRQLPLVLLAAIAGLAFAWWWPREPHLTPNDAAHARAPDPLAPASAELATQGSVASEPRREENAPAPITEWNAVTKGLQLHVRLRGLTAVAPWTASLRLALDGRDEARDQWLSFSAACTPDAEGLAKFAVPDWCATADRQKGRLEARDPNYQPIEHRLDGAPACEHELVLDVQVVGVLEGNVLDDQRAPVAAARVTAFAVRDGTPLETTLASVNTRADGTFHAAVPPDTPLFLLIAPMRAQQGRMKSMSRNGGVDDDGFLRGDLLPAGLEARATAGAPTNVGDIVLARSLLLTGSVRWQDGQPVPGAVVRSLPIGETRLPLGPSSFVQRTATGRLAPGATTDTDYQGEFRLPALAGVPVDVELLLSTQGKNLVGLVGTFKQRVAPPQRADFTLPRPVTLRATDSEHALANARVEIEGDSARTTGADGALVLVIARALRVRAAHERLRSPWVDVPTSAAGTTIDLPMTNARVALSIEFEGDVRVRNTIVSWRRDDGVEGREHLLRDDRPGAFQVFLEPGRYHLVAGPGGGERNGVFLLPSERDVDLGGGPQTVTMPALFGGTFTVMATDSSGVYVAGTCELHDRAGADCTASFRVDNGATGRRGELLAGGPNSFTRVLPPGDYELMCDFGAHGAHREIVTIVPRETTDVRIRLP